MRKQTKLVAVLSAAALLAIGASMTSFAATGWTEESGKWVYYDNNGDMVTDRWEKSGNSWFYLGVDGEMVVNQLVEDGNYYYYVDENGSMVTNRWVAIDNEDFGNENEPQQWWYYFQANGKAMQGPQDNGVSLKTINGKKYAFNNDGKMLYGWIKTDDATIINDDEDAWQTAEYYFGDENDGALTIGWKLLGITDPSANDAKQKWINPAFTDDEDQSRWFYFKTNGKKTKGAADELKESTINGKKYGFDEYGRMVAEWSTATEGDANETTASNSRNWKYFSDVESGARVTKGWFKVVPPENLNTGDFNDDSEGWYYADNSGNIYAGELKTISGKKYAFNENGKMQSGLKFIETDGASIKKILGDDNDDYPFDTEENFDKNAKTLNSLGYYCYYFGDGSDGAMKTGSTSLTIDGEKFNFLFGKSGNIKGAGKTGEDSNKLYNSGKLVAAGKDEKYQLVLGSSNGFDKFEDVYDFKALWEEKARAASNDTILMMEFNEWSEKSTASFCKAVGVSWDNLKKYTGMTSSTDDKYSEIALYATQNGETMKYTLGLPKEFMVVNTSGKISDKSSKVKDGSDTSIKLYDSKIVATYVEN